MNGRIQKIIVGEEKITLEEHAELSRKYPYFIVPTICALRDKVEFNDSERKEVISRLALNISDRTIMSSLIDDDMMQFVDFYPQNKEKELSTNDAIDTFLNRYGKTDSREVDALTKMIFNPMPDYTSVLANEENYLNTPKTETLGDDQDLKINQFIDRYNSSIEQSISQETQVEERQPKSDKLTNDVDIVVPSPKESENVSLTESFAKVMIKNRNYSKALEIITDLSLNNPEKSIYFADQIRFLKKLIINENKQ